MSRRFYLTISIDIIIVVQTIDVLRRVSPCMTREACHCFRVPITVSQERTETESHEEPYGTRWNHGMAGGLESSCRLCRAFRHQQFHCQFAIPSRTPLS